MATPEMPAKTQKKMEATLNQKDACSADQEPEALSQAYVTAESRA